MSRAGRVAAGTRAAWYGFTRRRTAVFFTFFFPAIVILIFGALVRTDPTGGGLFAEPAGYYVAGYLAVVVLFTPLSRVGHEVARHREGNRFEKLATTPLTRPEWLLAQTLVNVLVVGLASLLVLALVLLVTDAAFSPSVLLAPFVVLGVATFCGFGAVLGRLADSQDGVVAASNGVALPLLFLSETFVPPTMLPSWFVPLLDLSPLTYFARGVRAATYPGGGGGTGPAGGIGFVGQDPALNLAVLAVLSLAFFVAGAYALPRTD
jgi:ABC-2 type transport system permease protein